MKINKINDNTKANTKDINNNNNNENGDKNNENNGQVFHGNFTVIAYTDLSNVPFCKGVTYTIKWVFRTVNNENYHDKNHHDQSNGKSNSKSSGKNGDTSGNNGNERTEISVYLDINAPPSMYRTFIMAGIEKDIKAMIDDYYVCLKMLVGGSTGGGSGDGSSSGGSGSSSRNTRTLILRGEGEKDLLSFIGRNSSGDVYRYSNTYNTKDSKNGKSEEVGRIEEEIENMKNNFYANVNSDNGDVGTDDSNDNMDNDISSSINGSNNCGKNDSNNSDTNTTTNNTNIGNGNNNGNNNGNIDASQTSIGIDDNKNNNYHYLVLKNKLNYLRNNG